MNAFKNLISTTKFEKNFISDGEPVDQITITFLGKDNQYVVKTVKNEKITADAGVLNEIKDKESIYNNTKINKNAIDVATNTTPPSGADVPPSGPVLPPSGADVPPSGADVPPSGPVEKKPFSGFNLFGKKKMVDIMLTNHLILDVKLLKL